MGGTIVVLDVETTTFNRGHPFDPRNFLVSYSIKVNNDPVNFKYYNDPDFSVYLHRIIEDATQVAGFNIKFDLHWLTNLGVVLQPGCQVWDCQLAEFIYVGQQKAYASLAETLGSYDLPAKKDIVKEYWDAGVSTEDIPVGILQEYNNGDVDSTHCLWQLQQSLLNDKQQALVLLQGQDMLSLMEAERNGYKWDSSNAAQKLNDISRTLSLCENDLQKYIPNLPEGVEFNVDSGDQLSALLYGGTITYKYAVGKPNVYKSGAKKGQEYIDNTWYEKDIFFPGYFKPLKGTEVAKTKSNPEAKTRLYQTSDEVLRQLKTSSKVGKDILRLLGERSGINKVAEMIASVENKIKEKNWDDGCIHPQYNQNVVITGRLSSSQPNMQNPPPELDELLVSRYD